MSERVSKQVSQSEPKSQLEGVKVSIRVTLGPYQSKPESELEGLEVRLRVILGPRTWGARARQGSETLKTSIFFRFFLDLY